MGAPCNNGINTTYLTPAEHNHVCGSSGDIVQSVHQGCDIYDGTILTQANTGATGVVLGHGSVGGQVAFKTTSGTFNPTDEITVSTPTENKNSHWRSISGTFTPQGTITQGQQQMKIA